MEKFIWLAGTCYPRRGPMLEKGKEYDVAVYGADTVDYWVKEGAARYATSEEEDK